MIGLSTCPWSSALTLSATDATSLYFTKHTTGAKVSVVYIFISGVTSVRMTGANLLVAEKSKVPASNFAPCCNASLISFFPDSAWAAVLCGIAKVLSLAMVSVAIFWRILTVCGYFFSETKIRSVHIQICPLWAQLAHRLDRRAFSRSSTSSRMMEQFFPPSSSSTGLICFPATAAISEPTRVDPVKLTFFTFLFAMSASTISLDLDDSQCTNVNTSLGTPASSNAWTMRCAILADRSLDLTITEHPAVSGANIARAARISGAFHAAMLNTGPNGSFTTIEISSVLCELTF
ncbi:hypothetical protein OGATHE_004404 [Ogataea polymorpha]|uniref:Uncharacterized protein n=1 Tax=Ogataea polymorpha TaxID=460523 RepID=A0A9P8NZ14_9ASCO|nr:hypothetical protein OGATHE_004404 [Ogataea polymorpha]